jgi:hypothetical protein
MAGLTDAPLLMFALTFAALWLCAWVGATFFARFIPHNPEASDDFNVVLTSTLTLLGLIIGFSFSMAIGRYDQRKNFEEAEANAIGTEYVRTDLLPPEARAQTRALLQQYLGERVQFYGTRDAQRLREINSQTLKTQDEMWTLVSKAALAQPTPVIALAVGGMNDVLNSQGYTQAAWWNRIPKAAWIFLVLVALLCNVLLGYATRHLKTRPVLILVLPFMVSVSFSLIADIDSPRDGVIHVAPQNLLSLQASLR